jgi:DegV family protein with EDD domain
LYWDQENYMESCIQIITDSSCDLPAEVLAEYEIEVVPLVVNFGGEEYPDSELSPDEYWAKAAEGQRARTSQPSLAVFEEAFERAIARGKQVVCTTVTSKHSGTFNAARLAAQRFGDAVQVFDSHAFSLGLGFQAVFAAQAARAGRSMQDILALLHDLRDRQRFLIVLDSLENLRRGGRADAFIGAADRMTRALNIKLIINAVEGQLRPLGAARSFKGAIRRAISTLERMGPMEHLAVAHTRSQEMAQQVAEQLSDKFSLPLEKVWLRETGAVLATHAGPGVIAVVAIPQPAPE